MRFEELELFVFNDKEKAILKKAIKNEEIDLNFKDVKIYFQLKACNKPMGVTSLVRKCLIDRNYDVESPEMFKPRKKENKKDDDENDYYEAKSFFGNSEFRVDTYSRALNRLLKVGLVEKHREGMGNIFEPVVKD